MPKRKKAPSPKFDILEDGFDDDLSSNDDKPGTPIQRNAANARERARMRVLSKAFFNLKRNIPWVPADTKLSKLDTLRLAKNYITYLVATLDGQSVEDFSTNLAQPPKTAWPFIFQQVQPPDTGKTKTQPQAQASAATATTVPATVGQATACAGDGGKWRDFRQKDVSGRASSAGKVVEDIQSPTGNAAVASNHQPPLVFADSGPPSAMEGVNEYGTFGDPMEIGTVTATGVHCHNQQPLHHQHNHHQQHQHQHHHQQQQQHQQGPHHYQGSGNVVPIHSDGCHLGGAIGISGAYQRQHMTSIGSD
ncbi:basic helix-loop-helix neural transcription factor TAP [Anopheles ziemanni]|uniref:basic helix-loop-helix neural transcription factor TAP n=1 Tax=Anopheles coustani TaxID=139045 RepID=UPI00265A41DA|nr:basic helix-loop-helix neural transcription factor TAP [Anopheles coustani]XP_058174107.1 basic helix-loop-helix neural transcription factor TAP [Anopheles ziemanni]